MTIQEDNLSRLTNELSSIGSDATGSDTFRRYVWQAKQAVLSWLSCLGSDLDAPIAVVCERVEDLVVVYRDRLVFAQLKTKEKGSWSASNVCDKGHGIDSLVRTYNALSSSTLGPLASLELWLEGSAAAASSTTKFFANPTQAEQVVRKRIEKLSATKSFNVDDFLRRLSIRPQQPSQAHIDAVILQHIGALWPAMTTPERNSLYDTLLQHAEKAQANDLGREKVRHHLGQKTSASSEDVDLHGGLQALASQSLTRETLIGMTPPLPDSSRDELLRRINSGEVASALELKMQAAGATVASIELAQELRAVSDVRRLALLSSQSGAHPALDRLEVDLLRNAEAHSRAAKLQSGGNPAIASQQGEYVMNELMRSPHSLLALDRDQLFAGDSNDILGFLCHLSDACKFWWKSE